MGALLLLLVSLYEQALAVRVIGYLPYLIENSRQRALLCAAANVPSPNPVMPETLKKPALISS